MGCIVSRRLKLGGSFAEIRNRIETDSKYAGLKNLCSFSPEKNELIYRTEHIYPNRSEHPDRVPVLFLFSNPLPESVACGLFLSELYSRTFWQRLSEINKDYLQFPPGAVNIEHWGNSIPRLREVMLKGDYKVLLCARERLEITSSKVQAILVAHQIDEDVRTFCEQYDIKAMPISPERITR